MDEALNSFFNCISEEDKKIYFEIASFAYELGYKAKRSKTKDVNYVFTSNKIKKHILKFSLKDGRPGLKMKFYASTDYSSIFHNSIREVIEEFNYKYTGCYKCGKCKDQPLGYVYEYHDGRKYFRCGSELIELPKVDMEVVPEILRLLKVQHEFYVSSKKAEEE